MLSRSRLIYRAVIFLLLGCSRSIALAEAPAAQPATQAVHSISGTVTAQGDVPLAEMVVYLESPDADRAMPAPPDAVKVSQKGAQFDPRLLVVTLGQTVEFLNDEDRNIEHNVFSNSPAKRFDLGLYGPGQSKKVVFDTPGPVFLYCSIHRYMDGVIFVSPTPYTSRVSEDGHYSIDNVPPGDWTVKTWQRRKRFAEQTVPVTVTADKPLTVDLALKKK
jgi:plastocyanin